VLLPHDRAWPHRSVRTAEAVTVFGSTVLADAPHSHDTAPSDSHIFESKKDSLRRCHHANNEALHNAVRYLLPRKYSNAYRARIRALVQRWKTADNGGDYTDKQECLQQYCSEILWNFQASKLHIRPASWSSGQSLCLLIVRSRVRFPVLPWEFSLKGRIPAVTMVWVG